MANIIEFGEIPQGDDRPLPLIVADKWQFPLAWHIQDDGVYYSAQDWLRGILGTQDVRVAWQDVKRLAGFRLYDSIIQLPYKATNGRVYQMDFVPDTALYLIAQHVRTTKSRPVLDEIKQFLAKAGAFVDAARINPEEAEAAIALSRQRKYETSGER
jgi:hypothetical protein